MGEGWPCPTAVHWAGGGAGVGCLSSVISTPISLPELGAVTGSSLLLTQPKSELGIWPGCGVLTGAPTHIQSHMWSRPHAVGLRKVACTQRDSPAATRTPASVARPG